MHALTMPATSGARPAIGFRGLAYHYDELVPIDTIPRLVNDPALLDKFKKNGHQQVSVSRVSITEQAILSARKTLSSAGLAAGDVDAVIIGTSELREWRTYPEVANTEVLLGLGLKDVLVIGTTMAGCANYGSSMRVARNLIVAEGMRNVLVIETNQVRGDMSRAYGQTGSIILGDGAASCIVTAGEGDFRLLGMEQVSKPMDYATAIPGSFSANNVSGFRHVAERALAQAGLEREQIAKVFLHNMRLSSLRAFMDALRIGRDKLYADNLARTGHVWSADNLIGLYDYCAAENPPPGTHFLMLTQADFYFSAIVCRKQ